MRADWSSAPRFREVPRGTLIPYSLALLPLFPSPLASFLVGWVVGADDAVVERLFVVFWELDGCFFEASRSRGQIGTHVAGLGVGYGIAELSRSQPLIT